jgi:hypothetical protein
VRISTRRPNPFAPPGAHRLLPVLHWREAIDEQRLAAARRALAGHCADPDGLAADRILASPRPRGLAVTLGSLAGASLLIAVAIAGLAVVLSKDRVLLLGLSGLCTGLAGLIGMVSRERMRRDRREAEADRTDPVATLRAYVAGLRSGAPGEAIARLCPDARRATAEAPPVGPHRGRRAYRMDDPRSVEGWAKTFARSDSAQPRWLYVREVAIERREGDLAVVRLRFELRWWALWGALTVSVMALPMLFFALIPGLILYLALMQRQPVVVSKHLLRGADGRWYVMAPELLPIEV